MQLLDFPNELVLGIAHFLDDEYCVNALSQTCRRFHLLLDRFLYELNVRRSGACALEWAAKNGYEVSARKVLEAGAWPDAWVFEDWLPMELACIHGHDDIVRLLIDYGADPSIGSKVWTPCRGPIDRSGDQGCPIILAAGRGHESVVRLLISHGVPPDMRWPLPNKVDNSALAMAARRGHVSIVKLLISLGCDPHIKGWHGPNILADAAHGGHVETVRFLLEQKPEIEPPGNSSRSSALTLAARQGHADVVSLLLEHGKTPTPFMPKDPLGPLTMAVKYEHHSIVEILRLAMDLDSFIEHSESDDWNQRQLIMISAACGWNGLIEKLLQCGCSTDFDPGMSYRVPWFTKKKLYGQTPISHMHTDSLSALALAAHNGHRDTVALLLNHEAGNHKNVERLLNKRKPRPLELAIDGGHEQIVSILLDKGANPNGIANVGMPIYFEAIDSPGILELLFSRGANPELHGSHFYALPGIYRTGGGSIYAQALAAGDIRALEFLECRFSFRSHWQTVEPQSQTVGPHSLPLIEAAAHGGVLAMEYLLQTGHRVVPGSPEVVEALRIVLSKADHATLGLLLERHLIGDLVSIEDKVDKALMAWEWRPIEDLAAIESKSIMALVDSPEGDQAAMAATLDKLLAHGIKMETEEHGRSPLHDLDPETQKNDLFKLLLDRGANPLRRCEKHGDTPLGRASKAGNKELVRTMLKSLDGRSILLEQLRIELEQAKQMAQLGLVEETAKDVRSLLSRYYWRREYQNIIPMP